MFDCPVYICATQSTTIRYESGKTPKEVLGLYTAELNTCLCFIVISADKQKISLTHTTTAADEKELLKECRWAGDQCNLFIIKGRDYHNEAEDHYLQTETTLLKRLNEAIKQCEIKINLAEDFPTRYSGIVSVSVQGEIRLLTREEKGFVNSHAYEVRKQTNMLRSCWAACTNILHSLDLQYDGEKWTDFQPLSELEINAMSVNGLGNPIFANFLLSDYKKQKEKFNVTQQTFNTLSAQSVALHKNKRYVEAIDGFKKVIALGKQIYSEHSEQISSLYYNLSVAYQLNNNLLKASQYCQETLAIRTILFGVADARTLKVTARYQEILTQINANLPAAVFTLTTSAETLKQEGNYFAGLGKFSEALEKYNAAIKIKPDFDSAWMNKGLMHKKLGELTEAIAAFKETLRINPKYQKVYLNLWSLYQGMLLDQPDCSEALLGQFRCEQLIGAKVIFACADLKLTKDGLIKILEFGPGMFSAFSGFTRATDLDIVPLLKEKVACLTGLPLFLANAPAQMRFEAGNENIEQIFSTQPMPAQEFSPTSFKNYRGIYGGCILKPTAEEARILLLDDDSADRFFSDKELTHEAFIHAQQLSARPKTLQFPRSYHAQLAQQIHEQLAGIQHVILKVPDIECGDGIIILENNVVQLDEVLQFLLLMNSFKKGLLQSAAQLLQCSWEEALQTRLTWQTSNAFSFLVEERVTGKPIMCADKLYDPTMRVAFVWTRDGGSVRCEPFAAYWKLPPKPITQGTLRERIVSSFSKGRVSALAVSQADEQLVYDQLKMILPSVFSYMTELDMHQQITACPQDTDEQKRKKATHYCTTANAFILRGKYRIGQYYLHQALALAPDTSNIYRVRGLCYTLQENYTAAIEEYNEGLRINPADLEIYFLRGKAFKRLNQFDQAIKNFEEARAICPLYYEHNYEHKVKMELEEIAMLRKRNPAFGSSSFGSGAVHHPPPTPNI